MEKCTSEHLNSNVMGYSVDKHISDILQITTLVFRHITHHIDFTLPDRHIYTYIELTGQWA